MYNVVLVDDEEYILDALENSINWKQFNMNIPSRFSNAEEALEYTKHHDVDLLITDIKMPNMTGIELIEQVKQINDETVYIILSAHDSFDYAIDALKLSVFDYVLKPLDFEKLEETLKNAEQKLNQISINTDNCFGFIKRTDSALSLLRQELSVADFINDITNDGTVFEKEDPPSFIIKLNLNNLSEYLDNVWKHGIDRLYSTISYFLEAVSEKKIVFIPVTIMFSELVFVALCTDGSYDTEKKVKTFASDFKNVISGYIKADADVTDIYFFNSLSQCQKAAYMYVDIPIEKRMENYDYIEIAKKYIQEHFSEDISLTQISKHVCLSPSYFSRYFKNKTGKNIIDYINDLRIEKSKDLIVSTNENIITIYKTVGFKSKNHYYRLFKEHYGVTPLQYRRSNIK